MSVVMFDADHFKRVNDTYGHDVGDDVLIALAKIMQKNARSVDLPARLGGEEFIMLLPETSGTDALAMAERLREAVEGMRIVSGKHELQVTVSIGVATLEHADAKGHDVPLQVLLKQVDEAVYAAKHGGRNRVVAWTPELVGEE